MDIFKLFYEHDLRLDDLAERSTGREPKTETTLEDFMKPDPTYSKFYLTGSRLDDEQFGLSVLSKYPEIVTRLSSVFEGYRCLADGAEATSLNNILTGTEIGDPVLLTTVYITDVDFEKLKLGRSSNVGHIKTEIRKLLADDIIVLYKEQAHNGFDLHLFSKDNIYDKLFFSLKELLNEQFRFFSINNKRIRSERKFYFETWTLDNPPHGAEEVFPETVI